MLGGAERHERGRLGVYLAEGRPDRAPAVGQDHAALSAHDLLGNYQAQHRPPPGDPPGRPYHTPHTRPPTIRTLGSPQHWGAGGAIPPSPPPSLRDRHESRRMHVADRD